MTEWLVDASNPVPGALICASSHLQEKGDGFCFSVLRAGRAEPAFAIRYDGRAFAYLNQCRHVPVELNWQVPRFFDVTGLYLICAVHGALYAPETGLCVSGPCRGRSLIALPLVEEEGFIYLAESEKQSWQISI